MTYDERTAGYTSVENMRAASVLHHQWNDEASGRGVRGLSQSTRTEA